MNLSITQICKKYIVSADTIRYYEKIGLIPKVPRDNRGRRLYNNDLQEWIEMILCLRNSGVTIKTLQRYVEMIKEGNSTLKERQSLLTNQRKKLLNQQNTLERSINRLNYKIDLYKNGKIKNHKSIFKQKRN